MFTHLFETYRKTSESWLQMQQKVVRTAVQQLTALTPDVAGAATEWTESFRAQLTALQIEMLNRHRESLLAAYDLAIAGIQQASKVQGAKTASDSRAVLEDLWRQWFTRMTLQSETQLRDAQTWALKSLELVQKAQA